MSIAEMKARIEVLRNIIYEYWGDCKAIPEIVAEFRELQIKVAGASA